MLKYPNKIKKFINKFNQLKEHIHFFMINTNVKDNLNWEDNGDKPISFVLIEWFFDNVLVFGIIGLLLTISLIYHNFIALWLRCSIGLWLLYKTLLLLKYKV